LIFDFGEKHELILKMKANKKRSKNSKVAARMAVNSEWLKESESAPSQQVSDIFNKRRKEGAGSANWNGYLFEALIYRLLLESGINQKCILINAKLALIEDTEYDILLCGKKLRSGKQFPVCLSLKTSLRERYKQSEREGMIAKQVHRGSFTALLTMEDKIPETLYGLDRIVGCSNPGHLADLVSEIKSMNLVTFDEIRPIGRLISKGEAVVKLRERSSRFRN
jgi:hypothetical protein